MKNLYLIAAVLLFIQGNSVSALELPSNYKEVLSFPSKCSDDFWVQGGQVLIIDVENTNVLGVAFSISTNLNEEESAIIFPMTTHRFKFSIFGEEPMSWHIETKTSSDVCTANISIYSTWKKGDPPNR